RLNQEVLVGGYGVLFRVQFSESPKPENAYLIIRQLRDLTNFFPKSGDAVSWIYFIPIVCDFFTCNKKEENLIVFFFLYANTYILNIFIIFAFDCKIYL
ncbi:MAG: hypothetical protein IJK87_06505, partial [Prevotella sp.]|nr:hypothetical protein [Prevotella sp.]